MRVLDRNDYQGSYFSYRENSRFNPTHDGSMCDDEALAISVPQRKEKERLKLKLAQEKEKWEQQERKNR